MSSSTEALTIKMNSLRVRRFILKLFSCGVKDW
jgi:hypothetical protein